MYIYVKMFKKNIDFNIFLDEFINVKNDLL